MSVQRCSIAPRRPVSLVEHWLLTRLGAPAVVLFGLLFGALH
jgi:hypothetical protein